MSEAYKRLAASLNQAETETPFDRIRNAQPLPERTPFQSTLKSTAAGMANAFAGQPLEDIGQAIGSKGLQGFGQNVRQKAEAVQQANPSAINSLSDAAAHPWDTVKTAVGNVLPQIPVSLASAATGARLGGMVGGLPGAAIGGLAGAFAPNYLQEYAEMRGKQREAGQENIPKALGYALPAAGLETAADVFGLGRVMPDAVKNSVIGKALGSDTLTGNRLAHVGKQAAKGIGAEAGTEYAQTGLEQIGGNQALDTEQAANERNVSALLGGIGGGVIRGGLSAFDQRNPLAGQWQSPDYQYKGEGIAGPQQRGDVIAGPNMPWEAPEAIDVSQVSRRGPGDVEPEQPLNRSPQDARNWNYPGLQPYQYDGDVMQPGISGLLGSPDAIDAEYTVTPTGQPVPDSVKESAAQGGALSTALLAGSQQVKTPARGLLGFNQPSDIQEAPEQPQESSFTPTHLLSDGTPVIPTDEPNIWFDGANEIEDDYAEPINATNNPRINAAIDTRAAGDNTATSGADRGTGSPVIAGDTGTTARGIGGIGAGLQGQISGDSQPGRALEDIELLKPIAKKIIELGFSYRPGIPKGEWRKQSSNNNRMSTKATESEVAIETGLNIKDIYNVSAFANRAYEEHINKEKAQDDKTRVNYARKLSDDELKQSYELLKNNDDETSLAVREEYSKRFGAERVKGRNLNQEIEQLNVQSQNPTPQETATEEAVSNKQQNLVGSTDAKSATVQDRIINEGLEKYKAGELSAEDLPQWRMDKLRESYPDEVSQAESLAKTAEFDVKRHGGKFISYLKVPTLKDVDFGNPYEASRWPKRDVIWAIATHLANEKQPSIQPARPETPTVEANQAVQNDKGVSQKQDITQPKSQRKGPLSVNDDIGLMDAKNPVIEQQLNQLAQQPTIDKPASNGIGFVRTSEPQWVDAGNGFQARAYNTQSRGPVMEVKAPNGVVITKYRGKNGIETDIEGTLDQISTGEAFEVFKAFGKREKAEQKPWLMTQDDYVKSNPDIKERRARNRWANEVADAFNAGEDVPESVLTELREKSPGFMPDAISDDDTLLDRLSNKIDNHIENSIIRKSDELARLTKAYDRKIRKQKLGYMEARTVLKEETEELDKLRKELNALKDEAEERKRGNKKGKFALKTARQYQNREIDKVNAARKSGQPIPKVSEDIPEEQVAIEPERIGDIVPKTPAIHIEGKTQTKATPAEINDALKKASERKSWSKTQMREWLVGEIDKAIDGAKESGYAATEKTDEIVKLEEEASQIRNTIQADDSTEARTGSSGIGDYAKGNLRSRLSNIDYQIQDIKAKQVADSVGMVTFDVPGDGRFKVRNTKEALRSFKEKVLASPGFKDTKRTTTSKPKAPAFSVSSMIADFLADGEYENAYYAAKEAGVRLGFGTGTGGADVNVYTDIEPVDLVKGRAMFVGRRLVKVEKANKTEVKSYWAVIDEKSGAAIAQANTKKEVLFKAEEAIKSQKDKGGDERLESLLKQAELRGANQEQLQEKFKEQYGIKDESEETQPEPQEKQIATEEKKQAYGKKLLDDIVNLPPYKSSTPSGQRQYEINLVKYLEKELNVSKDRIKAAIKRAIDKATRETTSPVMPMLQSHARQILQELNANGWIDEKLKSKEITEPQESLETIFKSLGKDKQIKASDINHPQAELIADVQNNWHRVLIEHGYIENKDGTFSDVGGKETEPKRILIKGKGCA